MKNERRILSVLATICAASLPAAFVNAATMTQVSRSTWTGGVTLPSYVEMYIYVPDKVATNPPILVSSHSCGSTASGQMGNMAKTKAAADKNGFIMILPDNPGQNCWDVGSKQSLTHDGGGDTHAVAQMVRYALTKYNGDAKRVYAVGGSSGAMMTQALMGVYPEIFVGGAARAGVACGCWADSYASSNQWSGTCAGGSVSKTATQWGDYVRAINPSYTGHRPRIQLFHGESDETINYKNMGEAIKEWTNVLGLPTTPTTTDTITSSGYSYDRQFWKNSCGFTVLEAWSAPGQKHSMTYEEDAILKFFGLDVAGGQDPELAACGGGAGTGGSGGSAGTGGAGGARDGGPTVADAASDGGGSLPGSGGSGLGGAQASGGATGSGGGSGGGPSGSGGVVAKGGANGDGGAAKGGATGSGGAVGSGGASTGSTPVQPGTGGKGSGGTSSAPSSSGGASGQGGSSGSGGTGAQGTDSSSGCGCALGGQSNHSAAGLTMLLLVAALVLRRRQRAA
jgi:poly(hydroxyalkanoate) depolymerase family esterase